MLLYQTHCDFWSICTQFQVTTWNSNKRQNTWSMLICKQCHFAAFRPILKIQRNKTSYLTEHDEKGNTTCFCLSCFLEIRSNQVMKFIELKWWWWRQNKCLDLLVRWGYRIQLQQSSLQFKEKTLKAVESCFNYSEALMTILELIV